MLERLRVARADVTTGTATTATTTTTGYVPLFVDRILPVPLSRSVTRYTPLSDPSHVVQTYPRTQTDTQRRLYITTQLLDRAVGSVSTSTDERSPYPLQQVFRISPQIKTDPAQYIQLVLGIAEQRKRVISTNPVMMVGRGAPQWVTDFRRMDDTPDASVHALLKSLFVTVSRKCKGAPVEMSYGKYYRVGGQRNRV